MIDQTRIDSVSNEVRICAARKTRTLIDFWTPGYKGYNEASKISMRPRSKDGPRIVA